MSVFDTIRARRERAAPARVASVATCCNGFATAPSGRNSLKNNEFQGRVASVANVAREIDEVGIVAQQRPAPSMREAHDRYMAHHWGCPTCSAAGQGYGQRCAEGARLWDAYNDAAQRERAGREAAKRQQMASAPDLPALSDEDRRRLWWGQPASAEELERMAARVERGERLGLSQHEADALADRLHLRDRDRDDRHLCVECCHVRADGDGWRCAVVKGPIPREWVTHRLQRCPDFEGGLDRD
jgi:hypothetical protein